MTITYSVSRDQYTSKPTGEDITKMEWKKVTTNLDTLMEYIGTGHTINHIYKEEAYKDGFITKHQACDRNFMGSHLVLIDIDQTSYKDIDSFVETLSFSPNFAYYSPSDTTQNRRFRLVYAFEDMLTGEEEKWKDIAEYLHHLVEQDSGEAIKDHCGAITSQYFNGCTSVNSIVEYCSDPLSVDDIYQDMVCYQVNRSTPKVKNTHRIIHNRYDRSEYDQDFLHDLEKLSPEKIFYKYHARYKYVTRREREDWLPYCEDGYDIPQAYQYVDGEYAERFWYGKNIVRDGQRRRYKMYLRACITRLISPNASRSEVLYNVFLDVRKYFDNSDNILTLDKMIEAVNTAFSYSIQVLRSKLHIRKTLIIHKSVKDRHLIAKIRGYGLRQLRWSKIGDLYDSSISVKENLIVMRQAGLIVGKSSLYTFLKEHKLNCHASKEVQTARILELRAQGMSQSQVMKQLGVTKRQIQYAERKQIKKNENTPS